MPESSPYPPELELVYYPDPVLRKVCEPVTNFDADLKSFCEKMFAAMKEWQGVGLAAPQVGVAKSIFVTNHLGYGEDVIPDYRAWINPRLENTDGDHEYEEGCLSLPGVYGKVQRPSRVTFTYQDWDGQEHTAHFDSDQDEFLGIVAQHEYDHLLGKLHVDYFSPASITMSRRKLKDMEKRYKKATGQKGAVLRR